MTPDPRFHLYLLIGQSNMAGRGEVAPQDREPHPRIVALDREGAWVSAVDPIHFDKPIAGVGPGRAFAMAMGERGPTVRVGLIPCAAGGSPISSWQPGGYWEQTHSHPYDDAFARARIAMQHGVLKGILWHQGESDSNENDAGLYEDRLVALIGALRAALGVPDVPFVGATLGDFVVARRPWAQTVNRALKRIPLRVAHAACVDAAGLTHKGDEVHFDAASARELGRRYARAIAQLQDGIFPLADLHAHLEGELPVDRAVQVARERGVTLGVVEHGGRGQAIHDDESLVRYVGSLAGYPVYKGMQAEGLDWAACFTEATRARLDFVLSDALTFPKRDGRQVRLWTLEAQIDDAQDFMERYVAFYLEVMATPIDIIANFSFLPACIAGRYDELWTEARMDRLIAAAVERGIAIEINARYSIPSAAFIRRAKAAGARFSMGSNHHGADVGKLAYCVQMIEACNLEQADLFLST